MINIEINISITEIIYLGNYLNERYVYLRECGDGSVGNIIVSTASGALVVVMV